jgi:hypothetical protein
MDAELGLLVARYRAREEEADHQERRRAGFLRQETDRSPWPTGSGLPPPSWHKSTACYRSDRRHNASP